MIQKLLASSPTCSVARQARACSSTPAAVTRGLQHSARQKQPLLGDSWSARRGFSQQSRLSARGVRHACRASVSPNPASEGAEHEEDEDRPSIRQACTMPASFSQWSPTRGDQMEIWNVGGLECDEASDGEECDEPAWWESLDHVYVISFHDSGFYANRAEGDDGEPVDIIVVFESFDDAHRHCGLLSANIDLSKLTAALIEPIPPNFLVRFCQERQCHVSVQRAGNLLLPPDQIVEEDEDLEVESERVRLEQLFWSS
mmetsp:Transcript_34750/g.58381  ORF Transcript_34750/g.58381 Transcript_34750/m.58381 type:complete len:258 (+) Transcript_34750:78-851(+)